MLGTGISLAYMPTLTFINEWFVTRRGFAAGIMFGGAGITGIIVPILFEKLLTSIGYRLTLRIWAIVMAITLLPAVKYLIKGRLPDSQRVSRRRMNISFFKNPVFLLFAVTNLLQGMAFFIPSIYLPSYAADLNISPIQSTLVLSFLNAASTLGQAVTGHLSDRFGSMIPFFLSASVGGLSICLIWGLSKSFAPLVVFSLVYGISAGGYSVLYPKFAWEIAADDPHSQLLMVGFFYFERRVWLPVHVYD